MKCSICGKEADYVSFSGGGHIFITGIDWYHKVQAAKSNYFECQLIFFGCIKAHARKAIKKEFMLRRLQQ